MKKRFVSRQEIENSRFEVCVIGGGATGSGCALDAQLRGLRTVLVEAGDFASATSSSSTKLIHGGVRYLEQAVSDRDLAQYHVVKRALRERRLMLDNAPFLAHPLELLVPCFSRRDIYYFRAGMKLYDWLSGRNKLFPSRYLSAPESLRHMPMLNPDGLAGTISYADGQFDDARYNLALLQTLAQCGGTSLNYARVVGFDKQSDGQLAEAHVRDECTGERFTVRAQAFINATGPFADGIRELAHPGVECRLRRSKGSHILLPADALASAKALLVPKTDDGRVIFAIPWLGRLLVGTTDEEAASAEEMAVEQEEAEYLLRHLNRYLVRPLRREQIVSGFAGVRPLVAPVDGCETRKLIRDHEVEADVSSGLISVLGGKWTTYRAMAEDAVNTVQKRFRIGLRPCTTRKQQLFGSEGWEPNFWVTLVKDYGVSNETAGHLSGKFGTAARKVLDLAMHESKLIQPIVEGMPYIGAEVVYNAREEMATSIEDVLARRIGLQLFSWVGAIAAAPAVGSLLAGELGWSSAEQKSAVDKYRHQVYRLMTRLGLEPGHLPAAGVR